VLYSRRWPAPWDLLQVPALARFWERFFRHEAEVTSEECRALLGLEMVARWTRRGQWVEVYATPGPTPPESEMVRRWAPVATDCRLGLSNGENPQSENRGDTRFGWLNPLHSPY
jgi:hypothetical protein